MKTILEFSLPEETHEAELALKSIELKAIIDNLFSEIRSYEKHGGGAFREFSKDSSFSPDIPTLLMVRTYLANQVNQAQIPD